MFRTVRASFVAASFAVLASAINEFELDLVALITSLEEVAPPSEQFDHVAIDLGAGVRDNDPVFKLFDEGWGGVMIDGDEKQRTKMEARFPSPRIAKTIAFVEPETAAGVIDESLRRISLATTRTPDLLKIDIDSFDCVVVDTLLNRDGFRPKVLVMEVNVKFPPEILFALAKIDSKISFDSEKRGHFYGCSLAYQLRALLSPAGYRLVTLDFNNAAYVRRDLLHSKESHVTFPRHSIRDWDRFGYFERPERHRKFAFNEPVLGWRTSANPVQAVLGDLRSHPNLSHRGLHFILGSYEALRNIETYRFNDDGTVALELMDDAGGLRLARHFFSNATSRLSSFSGSRTYLD